MANRYHSRVFAVLRWFDTQLTESTWPAHPNGIPPTVGVGDSDPEGVESIDVLFRIEDDATITPVVVSPTGSSEEFTVDVLIRSFWPGVDRTDLLDRLELLAEVTQATVRKPEGGQVTFKAPGEAPWSVNLGGVARVAPQAWRTDEGWVGDCVVSFRVHTRI